MLKDAVTFKQKFPYALLLVVLMTVGFYPRLLTDIIKQTVATIVPANSETDVAVAEPATSELPKVQE
jgi:NADH:ubiquinone oxidoreductase subunit 4 (subunit M)